MKDWGFWLDGKRWASASYAADIFLLSETKRDLEAMIRDITTELEAVGLGLGANKSHWSSYPRKTWRGTARRHRTDTVGASVDLCGNGTGLEWIIMGRSQTQIEPRGSVSEKMDTHFQVKVCEWEEKVGLDGNFSVGEHLVGKRIVDVDESNEKVR